MKRSKLMILIGVGAVILGLGLIFFKNQNIARTKYPPATQGNSIKVQNQPAARVVTVDSATLEQSGFVVIHEANGSRLGKVLGISPLLATGENILIFVNATTTRGKEYFAAAYRDNDANSTFTEKGDDILKDVAGKEVKAKFKAL